MWPYAAAAAVIALFAFGSSSTTAPSGMVFRDYQWVVVAASTTNNSLSMVTDSSGNLLFPGTASPSDVANIPPPPNCAAGSGHWVEYPGGYQSSLGSGVGSGAEHVHIEAPGSAGNPIFPVFQGLTAGQSVYAWRPNQDVLTILNGYPVMTQHWHFKADDSRDLPTASGMLADTPAWTVDNEPPPPPGQSSSSGKWDGPAPGYIVWVTPATQNSLEPL